MPNNAGTPPMCLRCGKNNHTKSYCRECIVSCNTARARSMLPIVVHSYLELGQPQMVRLLMLPALQAPALTGKVSKHICQICLKSRERRNLRIRTSKRENTHNNPRLSELTLVPTQHHPRWIETHSHPLKGNNSISIHHLHHHHHNSLYHS